MEEPSVAMRFCRKGGGGRGGPATPPDLALGKKRAWKQKTHSNDLGYRFSRPARPKVAAVDSFVDRVTPSAGPASHLALEGSAEGVTRNEE